TPGQRGLLYRTISKNASPFFKFFKKILQRPLQPAETLGGGALATHLHSGRWGRFCPREAAGCRTACTAEAPLRGAHPASSAFPGCPAGPAASAPGPPGALTPRLGQTAAQSGKRSQSTRTAGQSTLRR